MIPMRDGIQLATDIYRPPSTFKAPYPVLLRRSPYNKRNKNFTGQAQYFAKHGYLVALQDCRGHYRSQGKFSKNVSEPQDGYDTVEWLPKYPESNGNIGIWCTSYGAHVQAAAAKLKPTQLRTILVNMGGTSNSPPAASAATERSSSSSSTGPSAKLASNRKTPLSASASGTRTSWRGSMRCLFDVDSASYRLRRTSRTTC
jgi:putative CocE/NonD family hydrolase